MSQHDLNITTSDANTGIEYRAAVNEALQALGSCSSGPSAPVTTYAYQLWADETAGILKIRNASNNGWVTLFSIDITAIKKSITVADTPYSMGLNIKFLIVDANGGNIIIILPKISNYNSESELIIKRVDNKPAIVTVVPYSSEGDTSDLIEDSAGTFQSSITVAKGTLKFMPMGTKWYLV